MKNKNPQFRSIRKIIATVFVFTLLAGCAGSHFERATNVEAINEIDSIKSIALLQIPEPQKYKFGEGLLGGGAFFFGVIGAAADMAAFEKADATSEFYKDKFIFSEEMHRMLVAGLQHNNIEVRIVPATRDKNRRLLNSYDGIVSDADAYLDIVPDAFVGYMSDSGMFDPDFYPVLTASVRLVSAKSKKVLFEDRFHYGGDPNPFIKQIEAPKEHVYETKKGLQDNKTEAVGHLITGVNTLGTEIFRSLSIYWEMPDLSPVKQASINVENKPVPIVRKNKPNESKSSLEEHELTFDLSGTYSSKISGPSSSKFTKRHETGQIEISQIGNEIKGTFGANGGHIEGNIEGNTIIFDWYTTFNEGNGEWIIQGDGSRITGNWQHKRFSHNGEWALTKSDSSSIALVTTPTSSAASKNKSATHFDLTGTYMSEITHKNLPSYMKPKSFFGRGTSVKVLIEQNGNTLTGKISGDRRGEIINGTIKENKITFEWYLVGSGSAKGGKGVWVISDDTLKLNGSWNAFGGGDSRGIWNLTKIE